MKKRLIVGVAGFVVFVLALLVRHIQQQTGRPEGDGAAKWLERYDRIQRDPSVTHYYTFQDARPSGSSLKNSVRQPGSTLRLQDPDGDGLQVVPGRWNWKKAVQLDDNPLEAKPFVIERKAFSVEMWFQHHGPGTMPGPNVEDSGTLVAVGDGHFCGWRLALCPPDQVSFDMGSTNGPLSVTAVDQIAADVWHHVAATWDGKEMKLYLNGQPVGKEACTGDFQPAKPHSKFRIGFVGNGLGSALFDVDELVIYNRVLTEGEALTNANWHTDPNRKGGQSAIAMDQAAAARVRRMEAWRLAQTSAPNEFRAFWCHSALGVTGLTWDQAIGRLATNGFNAILPLMLWGGVAYYPSQILPVAPEVARLGDQIAECLTAARRHELQLHVWKVNWNLRHAPTEFIAQMRAKGRLQVRANGEEALWLCPSDPDNQQLEISSMLEVARLYPVDGLHFDYIRYPDSDHCFCSGCRERFQAAVKRELSNWPREVLPGGACRSPWLDWRRSNITTVVRAVAEQAHALKPGIKISAAVFSNWSTARDEVGQDWKLWCDQGWLDFVCPMDYTPSARQFDMMLARQTKWAGRTPCYPGIGENSSFSRLKVEGVVEQIQSTRRHQTGGFVIFNYGPTEAAELLPQLGLGAAVR